jgi:para-nitrobenzyl esterase
VATRWRGADADQLAALYDDLLQHCLARRFALAAASARAASVRMFLWTHVPDDPLYAPYGAAHGAELPFLFDTFAEIGITPTAEERRLTARVQSAWVAFAADGEPRVDESIEWPVFDPSTLALLRLDEPPQPDRAFHDAACDFWDAFYP